MKRLFVVFLSVALMFSMSFTSIMAQDFNQPAFADPNAQESVQPAEEDQQPGEAADEEGQEEEATEGEENDSATEESQGQAVDVPVDKPIKKMSLKNSFSIKTSYDGPPKDFKDKVKSVVVSRMGSDQTTWSVVDDDNPVKTGDDVKFTLDFTLPQRFLYSSQDEATKKIYYEITPPIGDIHPEEGDVKDSNGAIVGRYKITPRPGENPTGLVEIEISEEFVERNKYARLDSSVEFTSSVDGWDGKDDGVVDVPIGGDEGDVEIIIQPQDAVGDIKIKKTITNTVNKATGELIQHSMDVTSTSGTKTNVTVTDTMVLEVIKGNGNFKVTKTGAPDAETGETPDPVSINWISLKNQDGETTFNDSDGNHDSGFEMVLPPLGPNEKYTITYDAYYPKMVNGSCYVKNTAIAKSTDEEDKLLISSSTVGTTLSNKPLAKTGELVSEGEGQNIKYYIEWTVIINPNKTDIGGWSLKDTGLYNDNQTNLTAKDVKLIKDAVKQDDGSYTGEEISLGDDIVLDGSQTLYTFPDGDKSNYVLKYRTPMDFDDTNYEAKNMIKMDPPPGDQDNEDNDSESTTPGIKGVDSEKEHEDIEVDLSDPANPVAMIKWKLTIDAKAAPVPAESVFEDVLGDKQEFDNLNDLKQAVEDAFSAEGLTIEWIAPEAGKENTQFKFKVTSGIPMGKTITFEYKSRLKDFDLNTQYTYTNSATLKNLKGEVIGNPTDKVTYKPMINKYDSSSGKTTGKDRTTTHYVGEPAVTYNGNLQTIKWGYDVNMPGSYYGANSTLGDYVIIRDELPEGLVPKYLRLGSSDVFDDIESATESSTATIDKEMPEWLASESDVNNGYAKKEGDKISDAAQFTLSAWCENSGGKYTVFVKLPKAAIQYYKAKTYEFKLYAEIPEDWNWGTNDRDIKESSFENNVYLIPDSTDAEDSVVDSDHTQVIINDDNARAIIKGNEYDAKEDVRTIPYRIIVNEEEQDMLPGDNPLDFKDTLTAEYPWGVAITLVPGSFKVYVVDKDSITYKKGTGGHDVVDTSTIRRIKDITDEVHFVHEAGKKSGDQWIITAELPDEKALLVQYDYHISGYTSGRERVKLNNVSELSGIATDSNNGEWADEIAVQRSGAVMDVVEMTLQKVDSENENKGLEGAVFELHVYDGEKYVYLGELVTDENGQLQVNDESLKQFSDQLTFNYNTAYRVVEKTPPPGYKLNPELTDFFVMDRNNPIPDDDYSNAQYIPDDFDGYRLGLANAFIYFKDEEFKPIKIKKTNEQGNPLEGAVFDLYRVDPDGNNRIPFVSKKGVLVDEDGVTNKDGEFSYTNWIEGGEYYLVEKKPPAGGYALWEEAIHFTYDGDDTFKFDKYEYVKFTKGKDKNPNVLEIRNDKPSFTVKKSTTVKTANVGDVITYDIKIKNTSKVMARGCVVEDLMGAGLEYVSDNKGGENEGRKTTWIMDIPAGKTITIKFKAKVIDSAGKKVNNTASVTYDDETTKLDLEDMPSITVNKGNKVKKSGAKTGDPDNPGLFMALLLISLMAICIRRVQSKI